MKQNRKKRIVEIYFILYLSALLFLLPDGKNANNQDMGTGIQIYQPAFELLPEKNTLICRVVLDSAGPKIIYLDSLNTIFYTGNVKNVFFEFTVEDQSINNSFTLTSNNNPESKFFKFEQNDKNRAAQFKWSPPLKELSSKTYVVKVFATGDLIEPSSSTESNENIKENKVNYSTQFTLLLIYLNESGGNPIFRQSYNRFQLEDTSYQFTLPFQNIVPQIPTGNINMFASSSDIRQIAEQRWLNTIVVTNLNLNTDLSPAGIQLEYSPKNTGGKVEIYDLREDEIILQGITPTYGKMKVKVTVTRKYDGTQKFVTFNVSPEAFEVPDYKRYMYPEVTYKINPKLPDIGQAVSAVIKDGTTIRARSQKGETFSFTPTPLDINKVFYLERYIDNELLGEKYPIRVLQYPLPEIVDIQRISDTELEIITRAFGIKNNSRNEVDRFHVEGNMKFKDLRGKITEKREKSFPVTIQYFRCTPKDENKPFSFKFYAVDRLGNSSLPKIWR